MDISKNTALIEALLLEEIPDCDEESEAGVSDDEVENFQQPSPRGFDEVFGKALENILAEDPPSSPSKEDEFECPINQVPTSPIPGSSVQIDLPSANTSSHKSNLRLPEPNRKDEELNSKFTGYGLGEKVVLELTEQDWGTGKIVYFDNFFSSVALLQKLKTENTYACGTIRSNRKGLPGNMLADSQMKRGDSDHRFSNLDIGCWKWKDNKVVHLVSNFHGNETATVSRKEKNGSKSTITYPVAVKGYNSYMGGVDTADRLRTLYCIDRKSPKWWHRLFWGLLDIAFVNSYDIQGLIMEQTTVKDFRRSVTQGLMTMKDVSQKRKTSTTNTSEGGPSKRRKSDYSTIKDVRLGNRGIHWPSFVENRGSYLCVSGCIARAEKAGEARESVQTLLTVCADLCHPCEADVGSERSSAKQSLRCALGTSICGSRAEFCMLFAKGADLGHCGSFVRAARTAHLLRALAEMDHLIVQEAFGEGGWPLEFRAAVARLLSQHAPNDKEAPRTTPLRLSNQRLDQTLSETMVLDLIVLVGFVVVNNPQLQETISEGWSVIRTLCTLPANWLVSRSHCHALLPTLAALAQHPATAAAIAAEVSVEMLSEYMESPEAQKVKLVQVIKQGRNKKHAGKK
ncbi:unnamed protein product [Parnassius apollo]|uniref:(apollo) hypothetical protein n=1 Tax=Parnassius apollo TaxID=110799 RepID=A0A8S3X899_PARAO|nr:unnamed protein product [Parnassius apollo]